jgi:leader peptidase (prepilin peptidase)/N-methyltransferase
MVTDLLMNTPLFLTGVFIFGLLLGSFLNVLILRLPPRLEHDWRCQCRELLQLEGEAEKQPPSLVWARSECPACGHQITAVENIPVLSYLFLRGRCSGCGKRISIRYPVVELGTALLFLITAMHFGPTIQCLAAIVFTAFLVGLTGIDIDHQLLPDNMTLLLLWIGLFASLFGVFTDPVSSMVGAMAGYLTLWTLFHLFRLLTGKEGMGFGDFKLLAAVGAWLGWTALPLTIVMSSVVGAAVGITMLATKAHQKDQPIPFGPFIAAAGWIAMIWGDQIVHGYLKISGLS